MTHARHRGYSLLEMVVVFALLATVFSIVAATLHRLHRAEKRIRDELAADRSVARLDGQLRRDAHAARNAVVPAQPPAPARELILTLAGDTSVQYTIRDQGIDREVRRAQQLVHRDQFPLRSSPTATWSVDASRARPVVSLSWPDRPAPLRPAYHTTGHRIEAVVGVAASD